MKNVLIVYGEGGHVAEMQLLLRALLKEPEKIEMRLTAVTSVNSVPINSSQPIKYSYVEELRAKNQKTSMWSLLRNATTAMKVGFTILRRDNINIVLSTGPGLAVPIIVAAKLLRITTLHLESWCRFSSISWTGKVLYHLVDHYFVQNCELVARLPQATCVGSLAALLPSNVGYDRRTRSDAHEAEDDQSTATKDRCNVLVTVGTTPFENLIEYVDRAIDPNSCNVICQVGTGKYIPENHKYFSFSDYVEKWYSWADVVVCHAGAGTVFRLLQMKKPLIVVPNLTRTDSHQADLAQYLETNNLAVVRWALDSGTSLRESIQSVLDQKLVPFQPVPFDSKRVRCIIDA